VNYDSDEGYFLPDLNVRSYSNLAKTAESIDFRTEPDIPGTFLQINFELGYFKKVIQRKYYKFQNMLADLGGLLKGLMTITTFFYSFLSEKIFYNQIIDGNIDSLFIPNFNAPSSNSPSKLLKNNPLTPGSPSPMKKIKSGQSNSKKLSNDKRSRSKNSNKGTSSVVSPNINISASLHPVNLDEKDVPLNSDLRQSNLNSANEIISNRLKGRKQQDRTNLKLASENFQFEILAYVLPMCCFKKNSKAEKQLALYHKFKKIIDGQMDLVQILNKIHLIDKINYVLSGDKNKNLLENSINPSLYEESSIPKQSNVYDAREKILATLR
jgi:hypothetical protein